MSGEIKTIRVQREGERELSLGNEDEMSELGLNVK
jgi:hypothetical protein